MKNKRVEKEKKPKVKEPNNKPKEFHPCSSCQERFDSKAKLKKHSQKVHPKPKPPAKSKQGHKGGFIPSKAPRPPPGPPGPPVAKTVPGPEEEEAKEIFCEECGVEFDKRQQLVQHMKSEHDEDISNSQAATTTVKTVSSQEEESDEEEDELRQLIHNEMRKCNVSRMTEENKDVTYPTIASVHKAVMETELFPSWSISTFRTILLGMNIKFQAKSEVDRAVLIEDDHPLHR